MPIADRSPDVLRDLGWLLGEPALQQAAGSMLWQVDATRQGHTILAWGRTKAEAWRAACRMASRVHARECIEPRRNKLNSLVEGKAVSA
jgi:hypothetical protein